MYSQFASFITVQQKANKHCNKITNYNAGSNSILPAVTSTITHRKIQDLEKLNKFLVMCCY